MSQKKPSGLTRRELLQASSVLPTAMVLAACGGQVNPAPASELATPAQPTAELPTRAAVAGPSPTLLAPTQPAPTPVQSLLPTPACGDDDDVTLAQTEGPFYTPNSPQRTSLLEPGITGTPLVVSGYVLSTDCQPVPGALLDFWHADDGGVYDNVGYRLRGHQFADAGGRYTLETIVPGLYPGRTRHIHVKVQSPNGPILTTQLYFPGEPRNDTDGIFRPELLMSVQALESSQAAAFDFVVERS